VVYKTESHIPVDKDHSLLTTAFQPNRTAMSIHNELTSGPQQCPDRCRIMNTEKLKCTNTTLI